MTQRKSKIRDLWLHGKVLGSPELLNVGKLNVKTKGRVQGDRDAGRARDELGFKWRQGN